MTRWRRVACRMWVDERFQMLSRPAPNAQTLWVFLISGPHTDKIPGLFSAGEAQLAEALGWPLRAFRRSFEEIHAHGMAFADWAARLVYLPNAVKHNPPQSPNVVKGWRAAFAELPDCALKTQAAAGLVAYLAAYDESLGQGSSKGFREAFAEGFPQGLPEAMRHKQEQKQEHQHEQEQFPPSPQAGAGSAEPALEWLDLLNRETGRTFKAIKPNLTPIRARLREGFTLADAEAVVKSKVAAWQGTDQAQYLRPSTLYGPKFDSYREAASNGNGHHIPPRRSGITAAWEGQPAGEIRL